MPVWLVAVLLGVFAVHFWVFARLALRRREAYYVAVSLTFALLCIAFGLRLGLPDARAVGIPLHWLVRWLAWASAAVSISWLVVRRYRAARIRRSAAVAAPSRNLGSRAGAGPIE